MFIIEMNPKEEAERLLKRVKRFMGSIPPHFELFATVNPKRFEMFLNEILYLSTHKSIHPDFFAFLRFYIATQEHFTYCYHFNKKLLLSRAYSDELLSAFERDKSLLPLNIRHQKLFEFTLAAIDSPENFNGETIAVLKSLKWNDADIYDAIDHGAFLYKFSKVLNAYSG